MIDRSKLDPLCLIHRLDAVRAAKDAQDVRESQVYAQGYFAAMLDAGAIDDADARALAQQLSRRVDERLTALEQQA